MEKYKILFRASVEKDLGIIPEKDLKKILECIGALSEEPRPKGCEKLTGRERYRLRQGRCGIVYSIQDKELTVWIVKASHRKYVYR